MRQEWGHTTLLFSSAVITSHGLGRHPCSDYYSALLCTFVMASFVQTYAVCVVAWYRENYISEDPRLPFPSMQALLTGTLLCPC